MVFSSSIFLFGFLPLTIMGYYLLYPPVRNYFILSASLFFYFWGEPSFILVMLASICINYLCGIGITASNNRIIKRCILVIAISAGLGLLFWYKYLDFSIFTINGIFKTSIPLREIVLPIGISFFTFQGLTYVCDLYWGKVPVQKNPLKIALYISLFPQLIAGPIVRYSDIADQIDYRQINIEKIAEGIRRFVIGLAKKTILANTLAQNADLIFNAPYWTHTATTVWLGIVCYTLQIYFDFSGYSDMAIGLGKIFGFDFLENFNLPYISKSIREFWRRWHISLSTFFRDYVYIPLGGNKRGNVYVNLVIVFFLTGLWHGAAWNFVIWGLWHGFFLIIERMFAKTKLVSLQIPVIFKHTYVLLTVMIGWVLFRADNLSYALGYLRIMFGIQVPEAVSLSTLFYLDGYNLSILFLSCLIGVGVLQKLFKGITNKIGNTLTLIIQSSWIITLFLICSVSVLTSTYNPFIYFRF